MIIDLTKPKLSKVVHSCYIRSLKQFISFADQEIMSSVKTHHDHVEIVLNILLNKKILDDIYAKLIKDTTVKAIYNYLIWVNNKLSTNTAIDEYGFNSDNIKMKEDNSYHNKYNLSGDYEFIDRWIVSTWQGMSDFLELDEDILELLKLIFPKPDDYELQSVAKLNDTQYSYNNEEGVLQFINIAEEMLRNNLVEFGKTNEKPLLKTLNILKSTSGIMEFYKEKKIDNIATDMLTRSFYYYFLKNKQFKSDGLSTLKDFITLQFDNQLDFFISRIFFSHLKKVRYDYYYSSQNDLLETAKLIVNNLIPLNWVDIKNIRNFCLYRKLNLNIESNHKAKEYYMEGEDERIGCDFYYQELYYEPALKALLFYLGALGVLELKYDDSISPYGSDLAAKGKNNISTWDGLKYVRLTNLGLYLLGVNKTYEVKKIEQKVSTVKFDEYKPIITVDNTDTLMLAKIDSFVDKYEENRYILSYSKIFKDCKNKKSLELKIDAFYKIFDKKLPKVFDHFFNEIKENSNMLKRDLKLITIELKNNKKLLNLFMTNKKLQEITTKASGYRVLVLKDDLPKLTKIVKDNGFFIEF